MSAPPHRSRPPRSRTLILAAACLLGASTACVVDGDPIFEPDVWTCTTDDDCLEDYQCVVGEDGAGHCQEIGFSDLLPCVDLDSDGFPTSETPEVDCPEDTVIDCDDANLNVNPGATETCNGVDDDCDGDIDEGVEAIACPLTEGVCAGSTTTCVDGAPADCAYGADHVAQEGPGTCADGLDNDCDGLTDTDPECPTCTPGAPCQGIGCLGDVPAAQCACAAMGTTTCDGGVESCVDGNGEPIPSLSDNEEICGNGIDDNCVNGVDEMPCQ